MKCQEHSCYIDWKHGYIWFGSKVIPEKGFYHIKVGNDSVVFTQEGINRDIEEIPSISLKYICIICDITIFDTGRDYLYKAYYQLSGFTGLVCCLESLGLKRRDALNED